MNDDDEAYKEVKEYFNLKDVPLLPLNTLRILFGCTPLDLALSVPKSTSNIGTVWP